jgi:cytochrome c peroxidase
MFNLLYSSRRIVSACLVLALATPGFAPLASAADREGECSVNPFPDKNPGPGSLKLVPVPTPPNLASFVRDRQTAVALGKAFFWDMQAGSDGITACASCHFRGGADPRSKNQANPGGQNNPNTTIHLRGPNQQLTLNDFPLHKVADPTDRRSTLLRSIDDVVASQGVKLSRFISVEAGEEKDFTVPLYDPTFNLYGLNTRRSEPRNTPTVINAAYNRRQFWDGRADNLFNGVNEFGARDPQARILRANGLNQITQEKLRMENGGLASQAVGPLLSDREMAAQGRNFADIGKRLVSAKPLAKQRVAPNDSVLGPLADNRTGLDTTYKALIEKTFQPAYWQSNLIVSRAQNGNISFIPRPNRALRSNEYTMLEYNFSLFFGLAVQLYEMTLISDDAPMDKFFDGNPNALSAQEKRGLAVFTSSTACAACHSGAETTNTSTRILLGANGEPGEIIERMKNGQCENIIYDQSFYNIGVRPTHEDLGLGNKDPWGNPLAISDLLTTPPSRIPSQELLSINYPNIVGSNPPVNGPLVYGERTSTMGAFKVPNLRNLALTAPYFHNGGQATIRQVVEFYNRGGDFRDQNVQFIDFEIGKLNLTPQEIDDLTAFLTTALLDQRVVQQRAPFDHPQLFVPNGHKTLFGFPIPGFGGAEDDMIEIPAVGRNGGPLPKGFLEP